MRKQAILVASLALAATIFIIVSGCTHYNMAGPNTIEYMGLKYGPSESAVSEDHFYYTGDTYDGLKLYADGTGKPEKVPSWLSIKDAAGGCRAFARLPDNPPVYAYTLYGRYNIGEAVTFGLMDEAGGRIELRNAAPYEIQKKENGGWKTIYQPVAAQVIVPLENGTYKEWSWDQRYSGGGKADAGDYRAVIDGQYSAYFSISPGAPVARAETTDYNDRALSDAFWTAPEHEAFAHYYTGYSQGLRSDIEGQMLFKAWMKGLDADKAPDGPKSRGR